MATLARDWLPATTLAIGRVTDDVIRTLLLAILHDDVTRALHRASLEFEKLLARLIPQLRCHKFAGPLNCSRLR